MKMGLRLGLLLSALIVLNAPQARAVVKITGVAGASAYNITSGTTPTIYGGRGGTLSEADCSAADAPDNLTTCNGCAKISTPSVPVVCNRARIYPELRLRISFTSDTASGTPILLKGTTVIDNDGGSVAKGGTALIDVPWGTVCQNLSEISTTCDSPTGLSTMNGDLTIGIDSNSDGAIGTGDDSTVIKIITYDPDPTGSGDKDAIGDCAFNDALSPPKPGICYFLAYPGDKKIFAEDLEAGTGFPTTTTGTITKVNFYYQETDFQNFLPNTTPKSVNVEAITGGFELVDKIIDGLDNEVPLFFRVSVSDLAGNEMYFTSDAAITTECSSLMPLPPFDGTGGGTLCPFAAVPDEVLGLLSKDLNCFIATAAYGSKIHPIVEHLREFRNKFLLPFKIGRSFVNWYYSWSPKAAHWLKKNDWIKPIAQAALIPVWFIGLAFIWWPITLALLIVGICVWRRPSWTKVFRA